MKVIVAIPSMEKNTYFDKKMRSLFSSVEYLSSRPSGDDIQQILSRCDAFVIGAKEKISESVVNNANSLPSIIGTLSIGLDHLAVEELEKRDVTIINSPTANITSVAEHIILCALALSKKMNVAQKSVLEGSGRSGMNGMGREINGKTFGTLGYGGIGKKSAELAFALGMNVIASSRSHIEGKDGGTKFVEISELFGSADIIAINVPLTEETRGLVDSHLISLMKPSAYLINTSRQDIVSTEDLIVALEKQAISGYAIDADHIAPELANRNNVIATPHIAGMTVEADIKLDNQLADNLEFHLSKRTD